PHAARSSRSRPSATPFRTSTTTPRSTSYAAWASCSPRRGRPGLRGSSSRRAPNSGARTGTRLEYAAAMWFPPAPTVLAAGGNARCASPATASYASGCFVAAGGLPAVGEDAEDFLDGCSVVLLPLGEGGDLQDEAGQGGAGEVVVVHAELV